jgi:hypothetical protein
MINSLKNILKNSPHHLTGRQILGVAAAMLISANSASASTTSNPFYRAYNGSAVVNKNFKKEEKEIDPKTLKRSKELEAVLISVMTEPMFPKGKEAGLYGGGPGNDVYRSLMIQEYGKIFQKGNSLGVAENISRNLTK